MLYKQEVTLTSHTYVSNNLVKKGCMKKVTIFLYLIVQILISIFLM